MLIHTKSLTPLLFASSSDILQIYRCNLSSVWECVHREEGTRHCVKMIDKRRFSCRADKESTLREIGMLTSLQTYQSSCFPRLVQVTEDSNQHYLVMDYVEGGSLASMIPTRKQLTEEHIHSIARSLLLSIAELHRLSVAHFNLTPENILLEPNLSDVVLCDFGSAWDLHNSKSFGRGLVTVYDGSSCIGNTTIRGGTSPRLGSLHYAAPELLGAEKEFGLAADMWSIGVLLYQLFCNRLPFEDVSKLALKEKITAVKYQFSGKEWHGVSRGAKQLISTLLHPDPQVRMTVGEALIHPWITQPNFSLRDGSPRDNSSPKSSKTANKRRTSLVQRLWGRMKSNPSLESSSSECPPSPLKTSREYLEVAIKTTTSTVSTTSQTTSPNAAWASTLPRPLDDFRRPLMGL
jgi:serine/threonine protein kinase